MLPAPPNAPVAAAEAVLVAGLFLLFGYALVDAFAHRSLDAPTRWGLAVPALLFFVVILSVVHLASGGRVFSHPGVTRATTLAAIVAVAFRVRRRRTGEEGEPDRSGRELVIVGTAAALGVAVWCIPLAQLLPLDFKGDTSIHMGWANQLVAGEPAPSGPITGDIPNYYPWLFHSLLAYLSHFTPGGRVFHALGVVQVLQVLAAVLGLYALGRRLTGRASTGAAAALFGGLTGGVGFVLLRGLDVVLNPRGDGGAAGLRYLGDLSFNRPYNFSFNSLSPPYPRDLAFALLPAFFLLLIVGVSRRSRTAVAAAGGLLGTIWLTHLDSVPVVAGMLLVTLALSGTRRLWAHALVFAGTTLAVWSLWAVPVAVNYVRLGGFVNTAKGPITLPPVGILGAWGIITPFALYGGLRWLPRFRPNTGLRVVVGLLGASAAIIAVSPYIPRLLGGGFATLGFQHRYWPFLALGVALCAALGASDLLRPSVRLPRWVPMLAVALTVALAVPSPVLGSLALDDKLDAVRNESELVPAELGLRPSLQGRRETVLARLAPEPGMGCTAAVPPGISVGTFSYTGYRHVLYARTVPAVERIEKGRAGERQLAHVRWKKIYEQIPPDSERLPANLLLTQGGASPQRWREVAREWGVDVVVIRAARTDAPAFRPYASRIASQGDEAFYVLWIDDCSGGDAPGTPAAGGTER
jgi:hypothetical protein